MEKQLWTRDEFHSVITDPIKLQLDHDLAQFFSKWNQIHSIEDDILI